MLAETARDELVARDRIDRMRLNFQRSMRRMLVILAALIGYMILVTGETLEPYSEPVGQMWLVVPVALWALSLMWLRRLARYERIGRYISRRRRHRGHRVVTITQISLLVGVGVVTAGWCVTRAFGSSTRSVGATYRRLYQHHDTPTRSTAPTTPWTQLVNRAAAAYAATASGERLEQRRRYALRAAGITVTQIVARAITTTVVIFAVTAAALIVATSVVDLPLWLTVVGPFAVAAIAGWYQVAALVAHAESKYRQFRIDAGAYVSLVAVCMTTQRTAAESITYAAEIGTGDAFETIHASVRAAPQMGLRVWEAVEAVGVEYGCRELEDLASSIAHVSGIGVGVESTVTAIATRMRQIALDDMQVTADKRTSAMFGPTMMFVGGVIAFLAYPLAVRVLDALSTSPT